MSMETPSTLQPCSAKTRISGLGVVQRPWGGPASAIQAAKASLVGLVQLRRGRTRRRGPSAVASATSVTLPLPSVQTSTVATPSGPRRARPATGRARRCRAPCRRPRRRRPAAASSAAVAPGSTAYSRSRRFWLRNSRPSRNTARASRSYGARSRSSGPQGSSTSRTISVSRRLSLTASRCSRRFCPALPLTSSARSTSSAKEPNWLIHFAAVFSPTPGMPGRLSDGSPRSAAKSGYCAGVRPYFSSTFSGVKRVSSETPLVGYSTVTWSVTSWKASRSPVTIETSKPCARRPASASVAITSSASKPSTANRATCIASSSSPISSTWPLNSSGVLERFALYSGELLGAPGLARDVERHREMRGRLVAQGVREHRREAVDRVGRLPRGGGEVLHGQGEERPVRQGMPVHQEQARTAARRRFGAGRFALLRCLCCHAPDPATPHRQSPPRRRGAAASALHRARPALRPVTVAAGAGPVRSGAGPRGRPSPLPRPPTMTI